MGPESLLSTLVVNDETFRFLVTWDIAGNADTQQLMFGGILELLPLFGEVRTIGRIIHLNVKGGSVLGILQLWWNGDAFFFDLFKDGLGGMIDSAGVNSLDFGFATSLVTMETIGLRKRCITSITSKASTVFR